MLLVVLGGAATPGFLEQALKKGFRDRAHNEADPNLDSLRSVGLSR